MGAYLSQPVTAKDSSDGASDAYAYGTTAMQGWRTNMEVGDDGRPPRCVFFFFFFGLLSFLDARRTDDGTTTRDLACTHSARPVSTLSFGFRRD
jgi:hypothetical protein